MILIPQLVNFRVEVIRSSNSGTVQSNLKVGLHAYSDKTEVSFLKRKTALWCSLNTKQTNVLFRYKQPEHLISI